MKTFILRIHLFFVLILFSVPTLLMGQQQDFSAYLFAYFKGEGLAQGEQIYFAISRDGLNWTDLNDGKPVLTSSLGEKGVRDPFIMRSADGNKFFVIATDLKIYGNNDWTAAQTTGSQSVMIWESSDLVNWSEQRMCQVAPRGAGCTWAPEAFYNEENEEYILFWSSKIPGNQPVSNNDNTHRVYYCTTKDFRSFSETKVWIELRNSSNQAISVIDATAIKVGDTYYRFKKNEATQAHKQGLPTSGKYIIMEKSSSLLGEWSEIRSDMSQIAYVEGPTCFKFNGEDKWCLFLDDFGGKGYYPLVTTDLNSGQFSQLGSDQYSLPSVMRHGSVVSITEQEYTNLLAKYAPSKVSSARINPATPQQNLEGWGVSLCWWANMCGKWSDDKIDKLVHLLVDKDKLNYNIFRYNIGGGDHPSHYNGHMCNGKGKRAEMEGFLPSEGAAYNWSADEGQRKILLKIKELRPDAIFEAFSNSPPYWMTYSGCSSGNSTANKDNLKPEYYSQFCDYLIEVCKHYKEVYGIEFKTLDPFNEPNTNYWGANGGQEGCHFDPASQVNLLRVLYPKLKASGLNTVISACDETSVTTAIGELQLYKSEGDIVPMLGQFNVHTYGGSVMDKANLKDLVQELKLPLWMSETGAGGTGIAGNLAMAQRMFDDLNYLIPQAWIDWQFVEEGNDQWCLVKGNFSAQTYEIIKNFYIRMQVSRFIKQGYTFLMTGRNDLLAALSPEQDEVVLVMLNTTTDEKLFFVDLSLFSGLNNANVSLYVTNRDKNCSEETDFLIENGQLSYQMGGEEIATFVVPVEGSKGIEPLMDELPYLIVPRSCPYPMSLFGSSLSLSSFCAMDTMQRWFFDKLEGGNYAIYTLRDGKKMAITDNGSYWSEMLELTGDINQQFAILSLGENCFKISSVSNDKLFDLEGVNTSIGTNVGLWEADETGANAHREWRILSFPFSPSGDGEEEVDIPIVQMNDSLCFVSEFGKLSVIKFVEGLFAYDVYRVDGTLLIHGEDFAEWIDIPLPSGIYVIKYELAGKVASQTVLVK